MLSASEEIHRGKRNALRLCRGASLTLDGERNELSRKGNVLQGGERNMTNGLPRGGAYSDTCFFLTDVDGTLLRRNVPLPPAVAEAARRYTALGAAPPSMTFKAAGISISGHCPRR